MNIYEKLSNIQNELKAPKGQYNKFGGYKYRSCEDILEAVKPICKKYNTVLILSDEIKNIGERYYVEATATLCDINFEECSELIQNEEGITSKITTSRISNTASAREEESKKGMDGSQITGTASSYARKYALNGLFNIDDTKDADTDEFTKQTKTDEEDLQPINESSLKVLQTLIKDLPNSVDFYNAVIATYQIKDLKELNKKQYGEILMQIKKEKGE